MIAWPTPRPVAPASEPAHPTAVVERMLRALLHRGPDGRGATLIPTPAPGTVALGHTRLAIIDPSPAGAQPMATGDGRAWIAYNGEIYNYRELRQELDDEVPWRSQSDTEVILRLYRRYGAGALSRLRGMFAFALWDADRAQPPATTASAAGAAARRLSASGSSLPRAVQVGSARRTRSVPA